MAVHDDEHRTTRDYMRDARSRYLAVQDQTLRRREYAVLLVAVHGVAVEFVAGGAHGSRDACHGP